MTAGTPPVRRVLNERHDPRDRVPTSAELDAPLERRGRRAVTIHVGSLAIELSGLDAGAADLVESHYDGFVAGSGDESTLGRGSRRCTIEVVRSTFPHWLYLPRGEGKAEEARVGAAAMGSRFGLWSYFFAGRFDRDGRTGRLLLCDSADLDLGQAIENYLRFLVATAALAEGGFVLHSAAVIRNGRSWLFFGPSGAGKSTTASHAPADSVLLGDDLILVEPRRGGWHACGVPFRGSFRSGRNASASAPIGMACRLVQAESNSLATMPLSVQAAEVLGEVPFLMDDAELRERAATSVEGFVRAVKVRRLGLRRDGSYWSLLDAEASGGAAS